MGMEISGLSIVGLDFETYSDVDINVHGMYRYMDSPFFKVLIGVMYHGDRTTARRVDLDFVNSPHSARRELLECADDSNILFAAHNAPFERLVLHHLGIDVPVEKFIDSAVVARCNGVASKLEDAAPQLLNTHKGSMGRHLIKKFCVPGPYQEKNGDNHFDSNICEDLRKEWGEFWDYCWLDAKLCYDIVDLHSGIASYREREYMDVTARMNSLGWPVDMVSLEHMERRYLANLEQEERWFRQTHGADTLNFNSLKQLKEWCAARGVKATSFDEAHVEKLRVKLLAKLETMVPSDARWADYNAVYQLLLTKQSLGGSSLKKLKVIKDTVRIKDGQARLFDQYVHCGAASTLRTSGRSVQMQNLKRFRGEPGVMEELADDAFYWTNDDLAENIRQLFTSSDPFGQLLVGDFSSVESRGLAYLAGAKWKLAAFRRGEDMYKVLAAKIDHCAYGEVTKERRQFGKVGELSCGYNAGPGAVKDFAEKMGTILTDGEASELVNDWRSVNPEIVDFWRALNDMLHRAIAPSANLGGETMSLPNGSIVLRMWMAEAPGSLRNEVPDAKSLHITMSNNNGVFLRRVLHGVYTRGGDVCYHKPSTLRSGKLWKSHYQDPKTKETRFYKIYGGKLAGILTQSFCRELFFMVLSKVDIWAEATLGVDLIGQFHDEIVIDWTDKPNGITHQAATAHLERLMTDPGLFTDFPLDAEIKWDYRYTK